MHLQTPSICFTCNRDTHISPLQLLVLSVAVAADQLWLSVAVAADQLRLEVAVAVAADHWLEVAVAADQLWLEVAAASVAAAAAVEDLNQQHVVVATSAFFLRQGSSSDFPFCSLFFLSDLGAMSALPPASPDASCLRGAS